MSHDRLRHMQIEGLKRTRTRVLEQPEVILLRYEREKRRQGREEFAKRVGISAAWLRDIEEYGEKPSVDVKANIRRALETCVIHEEYGVPCGHKLPVPPDEQLYAAAPQALVAGKKRNRRPAA